MRAPTTDFLESLLVGCRELEPCLTHACSPGVNRRSAKEQPSIRMFMWKLPKATHKASPEDQGHGDGGNFSPNKMKTSWSLKQNPTSPLMLLSHISIYLFPSNYQLPHLQHCKAQSPYTPPPYHNPLRTKISMLQNHLSFPNPSSQPNQARLSKDQTQVSYGSIM